MNKEVYITSVGKFLPGEPVSNDEMEEYLGKIDGKASRLKKRILDQNKIQSRHYAMDKNQESLYSNTEMASLAIQDALNRSSIGKDEVDYLAVASSQGDLILPGFASMVHAETEMKSMEIASFQGICVSGMQAMKSAFLQVKTGEKKHAVSCASEFPSRIFKASRYEAQKKFKEKGIPFDTEFLRWMLSDGAGAVVLQDKPNQHGLSLKIEWIDNKSYADKYDVCMYAGTNKEKDRKNKSWFDYDSFQEAADEGSINIKQDIRLVNEMPKVGVQRFFELIDEGKVNPSEIDWMACHYSSHFFKEEIFKLLQLGGLHIPEEKWFTNLYTKGNTGAASIYIILEELMNEGHLKEGQKVICMVPESGRFQTSYMQLTVVGDSTKQENPVNYETTIRAPQAPAVTYDESSETQEWLVRQLVNVWIDFEQRINHVPIIDKMNKGVMTLDDYKLLMLNIRQQVIDGSQWIARASSYITINHIDLRSTFISHASDEHKDYQILERDYLSVGGTREEIENYEKNIGSEALTAYLFQRASRENPFDLIGAMWIIEGLGCRMAHHWGKTIQQQLGLTEKQVSFLIHHGVSDINHFERLEKGIQHEMLTMDIAKRIVKTAKATARLYILQLEELGNN